MLRMGADMGVLPASEARLIDTLLVEIQPAHLQTAAQRKLSGEERDILRAEVLRRRLHHLPDPDMSACTVPGPEAPPDGKA
jgi:protein arginine kinase